MAFSIVPFTYIGGPQVFSTNFALGVLEADHIKVYVDGVVDGLGDPVEYEFTYNAATGDVTVLDALVNGQTGTISRIVPIGTLVVDFEEGADVSKRNLSRAIKQALMSVQEARDGREADSQLIADTVEDINALADGIQDDVDAINAAVAVAEGHRDAAAASVVAAAGQVTLAAGQVTLATNQVTLATAEKVAAAAEADAAEASRIAADAALAAATAIIAFTGAIILWSGSIASIPAGWALCNGSNGTPDLRNRMVLGAGQTYAVGDTGGQTTITQVPAHTHTAGTLATASGGAHTHTITDPGHTHGNNASRVVGGNVISTNSPNGQYAVPAAATVTGNFTGITINSGGAHTHTVTGSTASAGVASVDILNPYYALAYIMKL